MVVWLVGLSGAGKSTIGRQAYGLWKKRELNTVFIDGDEIRAIFNNDNNEKDYSIEGRKKNVQRIVEICNWLDKQEINVVCCVLCIFPDILNENRKRFDEYLEIYVSAPLDVLRFRDTKGLYAASDRGEQKNIVGIDIPFPEPVSPDLVLDSSNRTYDSNVLADQVYNLIVKNIV